jgi:hypothetical protein
MHSLARIPYAQIELRWDRALQGKPSQRARQLRGAVADAFRDDPLFHQHDPISGKPLYRYPRVQYRWQDGRGLVVGWAQAAQQLLERPWLDLNLRLGEEMVVIEDAALTLYQRQFAVSERLERYHLQTPALLFNQENYQRYQGLNEELQRLERDRLLVSNLLIALRGLEIHFPERLYASFIQVQPQPCYYKGQPLLGLTGTFLCNAHVPDGLALGHAVSHGYGWLTR